jgi:hypothetical protein
MVKEDARDQYWKAVGLLNEIIEEGQESREKILDEIKNDLIE